MGRFKMSKLNKDYLSCTFLIMLLCWGTCVLCSINGLSLNENKLLYVPYLLGGWSPTIASCLSLKKHNRVTGIKDWLKNIFDIKHPIVSYSMVVILSVLFILPQCVISGYESGAPFFAILFMIPMMLLGGGLEEAGWRWILQAELEKVHSFTVSTLIVSVIWWLWHLPLFYIQGVSQYGENYFAFGLTVLGLSFALAGLRRMTKGVWLCVLFHCSINALSGIYIIHDNIMGNAAAAILLILCSYAFLKFKSAE
ncbi:MAG: CPBP family intramembrane metalloprotease [Oscillospiraceae bacterium]|nr:CPBP family intramembrane metalloprotease [Oscillospiraceae bacterium]